jgi:pyruvate dehydrogenase E2 component (dihydrolipoamide acetyltransferase)
MATFLSMPKLGLNMTHGEIVSWLVQEGSFVKAGEPVLEVQTDKSVSEVEAPADGILAKIVYLPGDNVPCNDVIAVILMQGEPMPSFIPKTIGEEAPADVVAAMQPVAVASSSVEEALPSKERLNISPLARQLARELGVDLTKLATGGKRIKREDVEAYYEATKANAVPTKKVSSGPSLRKKIAEHMAFSARTVARVGLTIEADARKLIDWRKSLEQNGQKVSYNVLLASLAAKALQQFPQMNAQWIKDEVVFQNEINVGIAVDTDRGLVVPVLRQVNSQSVQVLQAELDGLHERALSGKSSVTDFEGGTFTISNLGGFEIDNFLPVINVPECAILAVGAIQHKVVPNEDFNGIVIRPHITFTLAFDHRIVDGAPAAKFLQHFKHLVEAAEN